MKRGLSHRVLYVVLYESFPFQDSSLSADRDILGIGQLYRAWTCVHVRTV